MLAEIYKNESRITQPCTVHIYRVFLSGLCTVMLKMNYKL
jgi:hypothetical protein